jgi:type VI secretion system protein VasD
MITLGRATVTMLGAMSRAARSFTTLVAFALFAACVIAVSGCAAKPAKPSPTHAQLIASANVNPDASGRASPIVIRLFQLRNDGEFAAADFFALYGKEKETLAATLISREEYVLAPGESRTIELSLDPQARAIGALAAFRDIRSARWRALAHSPEKKLTDLLGKDSLTLAVDQDSLTLSVKD